ncbi:SDR family NAD(P)-dependent oxidoreductase [Streptomyces malaysiensis]|uniref:SDR family oxidoreductase n=1 Tax=Streptomyces malaysiensis subsp. samsunensis TaxID=459658 RepID=A0A9X2LSZ8_STRMQ|nr:SDR family NAD(P)-dependent oxidoreductase [Streptomyces samsunensis]MCQ8828730.1 SDR family oxidoreductase [Streptomyces samsunensis]
MSLEDKVCVVTGGTSGIGLATVRLFAGQGARQIVLAKDEPECDTLAQEAEGHGWPVTVVAGDVASPAAWDEVLAHVDRLGGVDVLVNNAGYGIRGTVLDTEPPAWEALFATNVTGVFLGCRALVPRMVARGSGTVVNVASVAGQIGMAQRAAYCASKAAVLGLTRAMAVDHAAAGVRVNAVAPGTTDSPYFAKIEADVADPVAYRAYLEGRQLLNRLAEPGEIATAIAFLAGDASSFATGSVVTVDGGMSVV